MAQNVSVFRSNDPDEITKMIDEHIENTFYRVVQISHSSVYDVENEEVIYSVAILSESE